jgi:hypothetical protein
VPQVVVTLAVSWAVPPAAALAVLGLIATLRTWSITATVACAFVEGVAWLVATTW